jgi:hypothetical protein
MRRLKERVYAASTHKVKAGCGFLPPLRVMWQAFVGFPLRLFFSSLIFKAFEKLIDQYSGIGP